MLIGEVYADSPKLVSEYYGNGSDALHMAFNFKFLFQPWDATKMYKVIQEWYGNLPDGAWPNFTLSNHDNLRHCYRYRKGKWTEARARVAAALLMTLRGTPFIYYGEELGMKGGRLRKSQMKDPLSRKTWPLKRFRRDMARTPMQWDDTENAGFTEGDPWLPLDSNYRLINVKAQDLDEKSLLNFYRRLIWLRKLHPAISSGEIAFMEEFLPEVMVYSRKCGLEEILTILNFTGRKVPLKHVLKQQEKESFVLMGSDKETGRSMDLSGELQVMPYEVLITGYR